MCQEVVFQLEGDNFDVIQCHCSKCRKKTGSTADAMIVIPSEAFTWVKGAESISIYQTQNGFMNSFCQSCGCSLPNRDGKVYWVPAGILDSEYSASIKAHIYVGSKLGWEDIGGNAPQYNENIKQ